MADDPKPDPKPDPDLGDAGKKALDEERRARREAERKLKEVQDEVTKLTATGKTAEEQVAAKLADLEKRANDAEARSLRSEVAAAKGLTPAQAKRLQGASREELESDADDLLESFPVPAKGDEGGNGKSPPARKPAERLSGGGDPTESPVETDPAKLAAGVPRY